MFEKIANGWAAARSSWRVLMLDKELVVFPILSGISCLLVMASFVVPIFLTPGVVVQQNGHLHLNLPNANENPIVYVVLFAFYLCNFFVILFFNSALVTCALIRFSGENPTVADGLSSAWKRLPQIFAWALVAATVGWILRILEEKVDWIGKLVIGFLGVAWTVATYFVVPVLVVEKVGPMDAIRRSTSLMSKTWGESLAGRFGLGWFHMLLALPGSLCVLGGGAMLAGHYVVPGVALLGVGLVLLMASSAASAALNGIFVAALYNFSAYGKVPDSFDRDLLRDSFGRKGS